MLQLGRREANASMNSWIKSELESLANTRGWDSVPLSNPDFNFYDYTKAVLLKRGYRGLTLEEKTNETLQRLLYDIEKGGPGPLLRQYDGRTPFDAYFKMAVNRRAITELRDDAAARQRLPSVNIKPSGKDDVTPGISQEVIPGEISEPSDEYLDQTFSNLLRYLGMQRHGEMLTLIFRLLAPEPQGQGMSQQEIVTHLNQNQVVSPTGETRWSPGMVNSYIQKIRKAVTQYSAEEDKAEGGEGTLNLLMKKREKTVPDSQQPALPTRGQAFWIAEGDPSRAQPVTIVRRSVKNTRIKLEDGTFKVVPSQHIVIS